MTAITVVFILTSCLFGGAAGKGGGTTGPRNWVSKETDDYTPDYLWTLDLAHHRVSDNPNVIYAILHDVSHATGPTYPSGNNSAALYFRGHPGSYMEIPDEDGIMNATECFTWVMVVKPDSTTASGVLLEYWDGLGGIRVMQENDGLLVEAQDIDNVTYTITEPGVFTEGQWAFLTLAFYNQKSMDNPQLKIFFGAYDSVDGDQKVNVATGTILRGTGNITIGASTSSSLPAFSGHVSCLRHHRIFVLRFATAVDYPMQCDPDGLFTDQHILSEYTVDAPAATTIVTTETTTDVTTETTYDVTTETTYDITTKTTGTTAALISPSPHKATIDKCLSLQRQDDISLAPASVMTSVVTSSMGACFSACLENASCVAVTVESGLVSGLASGPCVLGTSPVVTETSAGYHTFTF